MLVAESLRQSLGIIPINMESKVQFAAIDIDEYDLNLLDLNADIQKYELPLVLCRTKSGGAHLYVFFIEQVEARPVCDKLREIAGFLGHAGAEIFPKQTIIAAKEGERPASWINMPYFNDDVDTTRFALSSDGTRLTLEQFIKYAKKVATTEKKFLALKVHQNPEEDEFPGGPPCLNLLGKIGFPDGTRNKALANLAVYAKLAHPDKWKSLVLEYNQKYMKDATGKRSLPVEISEVNGIIASLERNEFFYMCKDQPIVRYCDRPRCRLCKFGVGQLGSSLPVALGLSKVTSEPPIWYLELESSYQTENDKQPKLVLTTEQLQNPRLFQRAMMDQHNKMTLVPKSADWIEYVSPLMDNVTFIDDHIELRPSEQLKELLREFCTARVAAKVKEDMLRGMCWTHNGYHHFMMSAFLDFLERRKFKKMDTTWINHHLRSMKIERRQMRLHGASPNITMVRQFEGTQDESFDPPPGNKEIPH